MNVKMTGIQFKTADCVGSVEAGELHLHPLREAHCQRPRTDHKKPAKQRQRHWVIRNQSEKIEDVGRVRCRQISNPAEERRMTHLDRDEQHFVKREKNRNLDKCRQASRDRVDLLLPVELHRRLLLLYLVVTEGLAN